MIKLTRKEAITLTANLNPTVMVELLTNLQEDGTFAGGFSNTAKKINEQIVKYTHQNELEIVGLVFDGCENYLTLEEKKDISILDKYIKIDSDLSFLAENSNGILYKVLIPLCDFENFFEVEEIELDIEVDYQSPAQHIFDSWIDNGKNHDIEIELLTQNK